MEVESSGLFGYAGDGSQGRDGLAGGDGADEAEARQHFATRPRFSRTVVWDVGVLTEDGTLTQHSSRGQLHGKKWWSANDMPQGSRGGEHTEATWKYYRVQWRGTWARGVSGVACTVNVRVGDFWCVYIHRFGTIGDPTCCGDKIVRYLSIFASGNDILRYLFLPFGYASFSLMRCPRERCILCCCWHF